MSRAAPRWPRNDRELGIRASRPTDVPPTSLAGPSRPHAHRYEPTPYGVLEDMLVGLGLDWPRFVFVDLGSGKGRVVCLAACHPFKRVVGVELAPELHAIAEENIRQLSSTHRRCRHVESRLGDAASFELPREPTVLFLFNPFGPPVLSRVLDNLERAHATHPAPRYLLYYMPIHASVVQRRELSTPHSAGQHWLIWELR